MVIKFVSILLLGYLLGAIPFGVLIGRMARGIDVRKYGSGNVGFANVMRTAGTKAGIATLVLDICKGVAAALLGALILSGDMAPLAQVMGAVAAVIGHNWSIYLKLEGGKGVDTSLGGLIAMLPLVGVACLGIGLIVIFTSRYVSVGSMVGATSSVVILIPLVILQHQPVEYLIYGIVVAVLIIIRHRDNIANLRAGTERKLGQKGEER